MEKTIFEQIGGTHTLQGDYYLPNLFPPAEKEKRPIGVWGNDICGISGSIGKCFAPICSQVAG